MWRGRTDVESVDDVYVIYDRSSMRVISMTLIARDALLTCIAHGYDHKSNVPFVL